MTRTNPRLKRRTLASGAHQFYAYVGGAHHALGTDKKAAQRRLAELLLDHERGTLGVTQDAPYLVRDLCADYLAHAATVYLKPDGTPTRELAGLRDSLRPVLAKFSDLEAAKFGPVALAGVREAMIADGLCRSTINDRTNRIRRVFAWGASRELIPGANLHALKALGGLRRGRSAAREPRVVRPVAERVVAETVEHVAPQVRAMLWVLWFTGMRAGELCNMRPQDVNRSGPVWIYKPEAHKTAYLGRERLVAIGPQAQAHLAPYLLAAPPAETVFSPARSERERATLRRAARRTRVQPSQTARKPKARPRRKPRDRWGSEELRHAVARGVDAANAARLRAAAVEAVAPMIDEPARRIVLGRVAAIPVRRLPWRIRRPKDGEDEADALRRLWTGALRAALGRATKRTRCANLDVAGLLAAALRAMQGVEPLVDWHPHQLRHACATRLRSKIGIEAARLTLGHSDPGVTLAYAEADAQAVAAIAAKFG